MLRREDRTSAILHFISPSVNVFVIIILFEIQTPWEAGRTAIIFTPGQLRKLRKEKRAWITQVMLEVRLLTHALLNKASPKGIHSFISHFSKAPRALASGHPGAKVTTMVLLLPPCPMCCFKAQDKTKACNSDSATCHHTAVLPELPKFWQLGQFDFYYLFTLMYLAITQKSF